MFKAIPIKNICDSMEKLPPVTLESEISALRYVYLHRHHIDEILVEDENGYTIIHMKDNKIIHPKEIREKEELLAKKHGITVEQLPFHEMAKDME